MPILLPSLTPTTIAWIDWAARIQLRLKECPAILIADELRECAIRYYRDHRTWREINVEIATTVAGQANYTVTCPTYSQLVGLPGVWVDDLEVAEAQPGQLEDYDPEDTGDIEVVSVTGPVTITVAPIPTADDQVITATVAYSPTDDSPGVSEDLYYAHRDTIEDMALTRLMSQAGKPWTNLQLAGSHERQGNAGALFDSTMGGPVRRNRIRTKRSPV